MMKKILFFIFLLCRCFAALGQSDTLTIHEGDIKLISNKYFTQIEDAGKQYAITDVIPRTDFANCRQALPSLRVSNQVIWLKMILKNQTNQSYLPVTIGSIVIDKFDIYYQSPGTGLIVHLQPELVSNEISILSPKETIINCPIIPFTAQAIYIRIQSSSPNVIPIQFYSASKYRETYDTKNTGFGIFIGIVLLTVFYNLCLYLIVHDKSYLYYVIYVALLSISQFLLHGYGIYTNNSVLLNNYVMPVVRVLLWVSVILFVNEFLQLKKQYPRLYAYYRLLYVTATLPLLFVFTGMPTIAYTIVSAGATFTTVSLLILGIWLYKQGVKHAKFFMLAWSFFLISVLASIARNKSLLPYNTFTSNILLFGSVAEMILFSIALADKINFYRDENIKSQTVALTIAKENERLITGQNIQLENKVLDRTKELLESNKNLMGLVTNLKAAQSQLIETEKMASLGQLTAGIAHEINNPINFVKSNIKPLKLDFEDIFELLDQYHNIEQQAQLPAVFKPAMDLKRKMDLDFVKKEITDLLNGIEEGASRTAEIVQSLRDFSRTDEVELKPADINKSILSSLVLLRNLIPYYIEITPVFDKLPPVNCYPGKLNQVFINIIHNSIQAIIEKNNPNKESILIATKDYPDNVSIEITDTGTGMTDEIRQKMFDPFFTTKGVGEGTGLGLSIVFGIIEKHKGAIDVKSKPGKGTTIVIMIPKTLL